MKPTRHRNLYNGDCSFLFGRGYLIDEEAPFTLEVLERFVDRLATSGVDTYLQNPNAQKPWYPSRVLSSVLDGYTRGDKEFIRGHYPPANDLDLPPKLLEQVLERDTKFLNRYLDLQDAGIDWLAEMARICRERGISPWVSVRMNDLHGGTSWEGSYMNCELQKQPQFRLGGRHPNPRRASIYNEQALNYAYPEVREYYFTMIRELVQDYDYEGLELDWNRCAFCCEPPAPPKAREAIIEWIADIRRLTNEQAQRIGKPYPLGLSLPSRLEMLAEIGIDVRALAREGLIDFISPSNFWQAAWDLPYDKMREIVGDDVAIYGVIGCAPNWMETQCNDGEESFRLLPASPEVVRGNAAGKLALGCDGIETYNFFCADEIGIHPGARRGLAEYSALRDVHDLESLRGQPKHYTLSSATGYYMFEDWEHAEQIPVIIEPQHRRVFRLSMCAEPPETSTLMIEIVVEKSESTPELGVSFNDLWPNFAARPTEELLFPVGPRIRHKATHQALNFCCHPLRIREGWNEILLYNNGTSSFRVVSVEVAVC